MSYLINRPSKFSQEDCISSSVKNSLQAVSIELQFGQPTKRYLNA